MYLNESRITVRYAETDKMGIVHHKNYYVYFEEARTRFIKESGMSYSDIEEKGIMLPLVESCCSYLKGAKYEDELLIETRLNFLTPIKAEFCYTVLREKDRVKIASGSTLHAFVDSHFRIVNLKRKHPDIFEKLNSLL